MTNLTPGLSIRWSRHLSLSGISLSIQQTLSRNKKRHLMILGRTPKFFTTIFAKVAARIRENSVWPNPSNPSITLQKFTTIEIRQTLVGGDVTIFPANTIGPSRKDKCAAIFDYLRKEASFDFSNRNRRIYPSITNFSIWSLSGYTNANSEFLQFFFCISEYYFCIYLLLNCSKVNNNNYFPRYS